MKRAWLLVLIAASLAGLLALAVAYPSLMISPGALVPGHVDIEKDCFACHSPWRGAASERCLKCHRLADIGQRSTRGAALPQPKLKISFHQKLIAQNCIGCHSDHAGPMLTEGSRRRFSHALLQPAVREGCGGCHTSPSDKAHRDSSPACTRCHSTDRWKPATIDHSLLSQGDLQRCEGCHKPPDDRVHRSIRSYCHQCHKPQHWIPATFDHDRHFPLDENHNTECSTCHNSDDYRRYTCYGCHAHRPEAIRAKHLEEGIGNFENCVRCHKSATGEAGGGEGRRGGERDD